MLSLGMDIGTSTVKLVLLKNQEIEKQWMAVHHGNPFVCLEKGLSTLELAMDTPFSLCVTGSNTEALLEQDSAIPSLGDIPAIVEGVRWIIPQAGSIIEIGSQGARFITEVQSRTPQFAANEHCAGGTGSFFEDQMSRVGCKLEDYSALVEQALNAGARGFLSKRCSPDELIAAVHTVATGGCYLTPDIAIKLASGRQDPLTKRERQVAEKLAQGMAVKEIAAELGLSPKTVHVHRANLMEKLGVSNDVELARRMFDGW